MEYEHGRGVPDFEWEVRHKLVIKGFSGSCDSISRSLGLQPTLCGLAGEPRRPDSQRKNEASYWIYSTAKQVGDTAWMNSATHIDALRELVATLVPKNAVLGELMTTCQVSLVSVVHTDSFNCAFGLPPDLMRELADLGINWCLDVYAG